MATTHYVLVHARGGDLDNFKVFSDSQKKSIEAADKSAVVGQESAERARRLREILEAWPATNKIKELHIWSHSIGAGLFLGYQDQALRQISASLSAAGGRPIKRGPRRSMQRSDCRRIVQLRKRSSLSIVSDEILSPGR